MSGFRGAHAAEAFDHWTDRIQRVCGALEATPATGRPFEGLAQLHRIADLDVVEHQVSIDRLHWTRRHVAQARDEFCYLLVQKAGQVRVAQNGAEAVLKPGDCTIVDSLRPVEFITDGYLNQLSFHLPRSLLAGRTLDGDIPCAMALSGAAGAGAMLSGYARMLFDQARALPGADPRYRDSLLALLLAALPGVPDCPESARERQLQRICRFIDSRLAEADLTPRAIAEGVGISTRHLHRLFEDSGQSVGEWMRRRRLERARADLADPRQRGRTILDIAFAWGFNDASHFSRSFRAAFGASPRDHRRRAIGEA